MRRRGREFSCREQGLIDGFIKEVCRASNCSDKGGDLYQSAWAAFLGVYRDSPSSFYRDGTLGWSRAYRAVWEALKRERAASRFWRCGVSSLDRPVSGEVPVPCVELLPAARGSFQDSVCFHDYLRHMERDVCRLAYGLIAGDTKEKVGADHRWAPGYTKATYGKLKSKMKEYWEI